MKGLSLWQPWASLMAAGLKTIETRDWPTRYRGPLAIHAAKRPMSRQEKALLYLWARMGLTPANWLVEPPPYGAIVAVVELVDCREIFGGPLAPRMPEKAFGNFSPGRWGWITRNPRRPARPMPYRGMQGLFEIPEGLTL